ncbi:hypothetical protein V5F89_12450 [Pelagerythrobacter marensis]|uniref:Uncharacterized protein n=1 Tax=Pelagerythrobacter marensis TaxID=543877 RepID=A0ABZ2D1Z8_9SPHN
MKVKTLRDHQNQYGKKYSKKVGDEYEHPSPETDIAFGYVAPADRDGEKDASKSSGTKAPAGNVKG